MRVPLCHRPSCCPRTSPVPRRSWASCLCCRWTPSCTTLQPGGTRCSRHARSLLLAREITWLCSTSTELSRKSAVTRWVWRGEILPEMSRKTTSNQFELCCVVGVVSGKLCQQQEYGPGERRPGSAQRNLSEGTNLLIRITSKNYISVVSFIISLWTVQFLFGC